MKKQKITLQLAALALAVASTGSYAYWQTMRAPGTVDAPVLTATEAAPFTQAEYFKFIGASQDPQLIPWQPTPIRPGKPDYVVGPEHQMGARYHDIQFAVNQAIADHPDATSPINIMLLPGVYQGTVYIPDDAPPITIYGVDPNPKKVQIALGIDSMITPQQYQELVNSDSRYQQGDPAWYMYQTCASKTGSNVATTCAAVMWSQSNRFQLKNLTIVNTLLDDIGSGTHQGVALRTDGDKVQLDNVRLIGRQDTFFVNASNHDNQYVTDHFSRAYIHNSFIEGDVDYVFGRASAVFDHVTFHSVSSREASSSYVFAPDTPNWMDSGFLVIHSKLTCDNGFENPDNVKLGRAWDQGASHTGYIPGDTSNGQLVIRDSEIESCINTNEPWGSAATTGREYTGNINAERDLNDINFNRLWLYHNHIVHH